MSTAADEKKNLTWTEGIEENAASDLDEADEIETNVRVITQQNKSKWIPCIPITVMCMVITVIIIIVASQANKTKDTVTHDIDYVLPNASIVIMANTATLITGTFAVDGTHYEFRSISNQTAEFIEFISTDNGISDGLFGFKLDHVNNSKLFFQLYDVQNNEIKISFVKFSKRTSISIENKTELDVFMEDIICKHFVELSVKLGSLNYTGPESHAIEDLHRFAQFIWKYESYTGRINRNWVELEDEFEKVNEMILYSSNDKSASLNGGYRSLLGGCILENYCDNECFGMCGKGCSCWSWVCGDCECWPGCRQHDWICCAGGWLTYCCIDVFWIRCDGSGSC